MKKPPGHVGDVYRGEFWGREGNADDLAAAKARYESIPPEGQTYAPRAFYSTTTTREMPYLRAPIIYFIKSKSAKDVSKLSPWGDSESEVLFAPCTRFRITKKDVREYKGKPPVVAGETVKFPRQYVVFMEEI